MKQIKMLTALELRNLFGLNVIRHSKDPALKKKTTVFGAIIAFLLLVVLSYVVALCAGLGLLGAAEIIPAYLITIISALTLFLDVFKIGGVLFRQKGYDIMTSFPLSDGAVVVSRFLRMYVENLVISMFVFVPGFIVYAVFEKPPVLTYALTIAVMLLTPMLPLAAAVFAGSLITAIASRMKHKSIMEAVLSLTAVIGVLALTMSLPGEEEEFTLDMLSRISEVATDAIQKIYPPAILLGEAVVQGKPGMIGIFLIGSLALTAGVMWIVKVNYHRVCRNLFTIRAKHNYKLGELRKSTVKKALVVREARRYFSSGPYVSNTIIGPAMGAVMSVAFLFVDADTVFAQVTGQIQFQLNITAAIPVMAAAVMTMANASSMSVSLEGKEWWLIKSLPLSTKMILDAKVLFHLLLTAPFLAVSQICTWIAFKPGFIMSVCMLMLSVQIVVFSYVFGIRINLLFPKFDWENETVAVKQSASSLLGGMGGMLVAFLFVIPIVIVPQVYCLPVCIAEFLVLGGLTWFLYEKNNKTDLSMIG